MSSDLNSVIVIMADADPDDSVNQVAMKLPLFWVDNPMRWFQQAEAQFRVKNITRSTTKFDHVLARLPSDATVSIGDVIDRATTTVNPSETPYEDLKARLLKAYMPGPYKMLDTLLDHPALGDRTPSKMMDEMLALLPTGVQPNLLFNARLPTTLSQVLATQKHEDPRALAEATDHLYDSGIHPPSVAAAVLPPSTAEVCAVPAARSGRSLPRGSGGRSATPGRMCFFHARFADKAGRETPTAAAGAAAAITIRHLRHLSPVFSGQALWWEVPGGHRRK